VWAYAAPADLRKGFDGLYGLVVKELGGDPLSGDCFLFVNRYRTRAKVLLWDGTGLCIYQKRLERGRFACLWKREEAKPSGIELTLSELSLFLEGCQLLQRVRLSPEPFVPKAVTESVATVAK
jgi:transposase